MKILHTSDWHLGKRLFGRERLDAQRRMGEYLTEFVRERGIGLVVVAGDVYDTATPSSDAENLFYDIASALGEVCTVVAISGNHDDPDRLAAAQELARRHDVILAGDFGVPATSRHVTASGEGWLRIERDGSCVNLVVLPYPTDARTGDAVKEGETYADRVRIRLAASASAAFAHGGYRMVAAHLFCEGGVKSGSERDIELGTARIVPLGCLPDCDYVALGHIHKYLRYNGHVCYSGAPMPFTFDEADSAKYVVVIDTETGERERVELPAFDRLCAGEFSDADAADAFLTENADALCAVTLHLDEPLPVRDQRILRAHGNLVRLVPVLAPRQGAGLRERERKTTEQIFREFCAASNAEATDELVALFLELVGEA